MSSNHVYHRAPIVRLFDKVLLSGFVIISFVVYAIRERLARPDTIAAEPKTSTDTQNNLPNQQGNPNSTISEAMPTAVVIPTPLADSPFGQSHYADGVYNGPTVNVYYGLVSVQATVKNGSIVDVQFLQYPNDRRTSIRINSFAMPYLQQEAIQAQTANVNLISGATLTSEGFVMSLDAALKSAAN